MCKFSGSQAFNLFMVLFVAGYYVTIELLGGSGDLVVR